jgi:hypothetical protein
MLFVAEKRINRQGAIFERPYLLGFVERKFHVFDLCQQAEICGTGCAIDNHGKLDEVSQDPPPTLLARGLPLRSLSFRAFLQLSYLLSRVGKTTRPTYL